MGKEASSKKVSRRTILKAGAALGALQVASPFILSARGETPIKLGMVDPLTGVYAAVARGEVDGAVLDGVGVAREPAGLPSELRDALLLGVVGLPLALDLALLRHQVIAIVATVDL